MKGNGAKNREEFPALPNRKQSNQPEILPTNQVNSILEGAQGGPWSFDNKPMVLKPWTKDMSMEKEGLKTVPIWIKLPQLPLQFWSKSMLSTLGKPLFTDRMTASHERLNYARVCVEMDVDSDFPQEIPNDWVHKHKVEYGWKPAMCKYCKVFGHVEISCYKKPVSHQVWKQKQSKDIESTIGPDSNPSMKENMNSEQWEKAEHTASHLKKADNGLLDEYSASDGFKFHLKCQELLVNHLCFTDELFIMAAADQEALTKVKQALEEFGCLSGLYVLLVRKCSGYMSPEYAMEGLFSIKSDVFAFGVLLLEIVSGKKSTGFHDLDYQSLLGYVSSC
ncbi:hypothetical protein RJ640_017590 [Escallonia rubra]|uniref:Serine-threonine/tyrosine-protein kinase catalytic domain-containing protein n=1 Tax=Escallonia rubra TaxID=112253 RepID=A0AA88RE85_9ASTE|nr:hypothetical protein RJ640_017590 [Escallonia rubra]